MNLALEAGTSRAQALAALRRAFAAADVSEAALDARILLEEATGAGAAALLTAPEAPLGEAAAARLAAFARERLAGRPVWRILGTRAFWGIDFALSPETLVPRPDTETLVETVLALRKDDRKDDREEASGRAQRILDLGTGTGCILVALLHERPRACGIGVDRAEGACRTARGNAQRAGIGDRAAFVVGDWASPVAARFDIVVSNPPYIPAGEIDALAREVAAHEPRAALDGGADGLDAYREILREAPRLLAPGGLLALEVGIGQAQAVAALGEATGLALAAIVPDLAGIPRVVALARRPEIVSGTPPPVSHL